MVLVKSDYSAFKSENLMLSFRTQFITELYICGSLSNVSVYATVLDAVRHGFSVTLVEDCMGFRKFKLHEETMRKMADMMGANGITSSELIDDQDWEETHADRPERSYEENNNAPSGIEDDMDVLAVKPTLKSDSQKPVTNTDGKAPVIEFDSSSDSGTENIDIPDIPRRVPRSPESHLVKSKPSRPRVRRAADGSSRPSTSQSGSTRNPPPKSSPPVTSGSNPVPMAVSTPSPKTHQRKSRAPDPQDEYLGPNDKIAEGDSRIIYDLPLPSNCFELLRSEINWQKMYHMSGQVPRLVAVQGMVQPDGSVPIYRHPADEAPLLSPFSPTVDEIRNIVERILGHPLNHALIQLYRDGEDRISEHSDKTLDIVRGSYICNVSIGAERIMTLRTKAAASKEEVSGTGGKAAESGRCTEKVPMPHNSLFVLGEKSNMRWLHGIRPDKRPDPSKSTEEKAFNGERISLTFRNVGTFTDPEMKKIWGQGARSKGQPHAGDVIHGQPVETDRMIQAFGKENRSTEFDWDGVYGQGFDVVNFETISIAKLLPARRSVDEVHGVVDLRVRLCLVENGIRYEIVTLENLPHLVRESVGITDPTTGSVDQPILLLPSDGTNCITGDIDILSYVAEQQGLRESGASLTTIKQNIKASEDLHRQWRSVKQQQQFKEIIPFLVPLETALRRGGGYYLNGQVFDVDDCAMWPVLQDIVQHAVRGSPADESRFPSILAYVNKVGKRACVKTVLEEMHLSNS